MSKNKPKKYSFTRQEFMYVSEHRALIELHDSFIRRYIAAAVLPRLKIKPEGFYIAVSEDGNGIDVTKVDKPKEEKPKAEFVPVDRAGNPLKPKTPKKN